MAEVESEEDKNFPVEVDTEESSFELCILEFSHKSGPDGHNPEVGS